MSSEKHKDTIPPLKGLTDKLISALSRRPGVRRVAVLNFLVTVENCHDRETALANLELDKRLYRWDIRTVQAIELGIAIAFRDWR